MLIFRFLQVVSLAYLCSLLFEMVRCEHHQTPVNLDREGPSILKHSRELRRSYKLWNRCSGRHVQIVGKTANARAPTNSTYAQLSFISVHTRHHPNAMNIVGEASGRYLCFNKRGKLIARFNGRKKMCLFKEDFSEDYYTVLQSVYDPSWYVGFNRRGKPLKANLHSKQKQRNCFHFVKRDHSYGLQEPRRTGPKIKDPSKLKDLLTGRGPTSTRRRKVVPRSPIR